MNLKMSVAYLSLGTNIGDKKQNIHTAISLLNQTVGAVAEVSDVIETEPWGFSSDNSFLNCAVKVETELSPKQLLQATQQIEKSMGREYKSVGGNYKDRVIDVDILLYDSAVIELKESDGVALSIPHKLMHEREFVLQPLSDIASEVVHPVLNKTISRLYEELLSRQYITV